MKRSSKQFILIVLFHCFICTTALSTPISLTLGFDSLYISEGRNNLTDGHLLSVLAEKEFEGQGSSRWLTHLWKAESVNNTDNHYQELNIGLGYSIFLDRLTITPQYTYLTFQHENSHDHELGLDIEYQGSWALVYLMSYVHSKQSAGSFFSWRVTHQRKINDRFTLAPYISVGINNRYVVNEHNGWNDLQVGLEANYRFNSRLKLQSYLANSKGLQKQQGETLEDFSWFGLSLNYLF
ncbi:hypothetical protein [Aliikangiella sp. IMCC44359]|uniref:hypothetical protein n=1 Tax=Aliikangiella sp. IMCC44359 TaxID=3459125 RepID=UPI00403A9CA1